MSELCLYILYIILMCCFISLYLIRTVRYLLNYKQVFIVMTKPIALFSFFTSLALPLFFLYLTEV